MRIYFCHRVHCDTINSSDVCLPVCMFVFFVSLVITSIISLSTYYAICTHPYISIEFKAFTVVVVVGIRHHAASHLIYSRVAHNFFW